MKKAIVAICSLASLTLSAQVDFSMKATNKPSDSLLIRSRTFTKWIVADKSGEFKATLEAPDGFYQIKLAEQYTNLYLKKGKDLHATLDYNKFDESLTYTGKGAKENNFIAKRFLSQSDKDYDGAMKASDATQLKAEIEKIKTKIFTSIPKGLDEDFVTEFKKSNELELAGLDKYVSK